MNERKTEDIVEARLRKLGYYKPKTETVVEKQKSDSPRIQKLLENASKRGGGVGKPEFLIHSSTFGDFIIVIECKGDFRRHKSVAGNRFADFAVDGVLLYASFLAKDFDVLAIAVSGEDTKNLQVSHFLQLKGMATAIPFEAPSGMLSFEEYYEAFARSDAKFRQDYDVLLDYSRGLNNTLQAKKVTEADRGFLISGILIALNNEAFQTSYHAHKTAKQLAGSLLSTIRDEFETAKLPQDRHDILVQAFSFISHSPALSDRDFFISLIEGIDKNINGFMKSHQYYDTIGQFYVEFLRYANNDKGLGIVLTPHHIIELFTELADVHKDSVVFDNCCGTGGLLIGAMRKMIEGAQGKASKEKDIKEKQLFGVEFQPKIYALAVSNMILHGDGKTNVYRGDCFKDSWQLLKQKPTVGLLNPPYKNKTVADDREELEFVLNNLAHLKQGGACVAILPITCATAPSGAIAALKETLLKEHTLEAVLSMPIDLFHNSKTTVVTCVMVFTAHRPHPVGKKTWFGYMRDDGFVKTKHRGRIDANASWDAIKQRWVNAYRNREIVHGLSVAKEVTHTDEWCAEAYLETDYESITGVMLTDACKRHLIGRVTRRVTTIPNNEDSNEE